MMKKSVGSYPQTAEGDTNLKSMVSDPLANQSKKKLQNKQAEDSPRELRSRCTKKSGGEKVCVFPDSKGNASPCADEDSPVSGPKTRRSWGNLEKARELIKDGARKRVYNDWLAQQLDCSNSVVTPVK